jgi:hypothetical protein
MNTLLTISLKESPGKKQYSKAFNKEKRAQPPPQIDPSVKEKDVPSVEGVVAAGGEAITVAMGAMRAKGAFTIRRNFTTVTLDMLKQSAE